MVDRFNAPVWKQDAYTLRRLQEVVAQKILEFRASRLLPGIVVDMGAGDIPYKRLFVDVGATYVSCDIEYGPNVDVVLDERSRASQLADEYANCVVSFQVLEHVWNIDSYLNECRRILSTDGKLLLSTHGTWLYHPHPTDYRRWTRDGLVKEIESRGFTIDAVVPVIGPLAWTSQFRCLAYSHVLQRIGLLGRFLACISNAFFYARMKVEDFVTPQSLINSNASVYVVVASKAK